MMSNNKPVIQVNLEKDRILRLKAGSCEATLTNAHEFEMNFCKTQIESLEEFCVFVIEVNIILQEVERQLNAENAPLVR